MNKSALTTTIYLVAAIFLISNTNQPEPSPDIEIDKHAGVNLIIDVNHFNGKL